MISGSLLSLDNEVIEAYLLPIISLLIAYNSAGQKTNDPATRRVVDAALYVQKQSNL